MRSIGSFYAFLIRHGIEVTLEQPMDFSEVAKVSLQYSLEIPDSAHIVKARQEEADYLITIDPDFLDAEPKITHPRILNPATLGTIPQLRR